MAKCDACGREVGMPYQCRHCGGTFCAEHRLPENHDCPGLDDWGDPSGVFSGSGPSTAGSGTGRQESRSLADRVFDTGRGGPLSYFRGNMTFVFLGLMWVTFLAEWILAPILGIPRGSMLWYDLFTVNTRHPLYVWTWVTSVFAHGGFGHIFLNSLVLYFFGPVVERRIGTKKFAALFIVSGAIAGLAQVGATILTAPGTFSAVLGASGAIAALMGVLTVLNPNLRIYLYFIIPMPLWVATLLFAAYSVFVSTAGGGIGAGGVAQLAHLAGLVLGLLYGLKLKREGERAPQELQFGGGGGGRGPGGPGGRF